jgi:thioredoxin reductase (NADPH)
MASSEQKTDVVTISIAGHQSCSFFQKCANVIVALESLHPTKFKARILEFENEEQFTKWLPTQKATLAPQAQALNDHTASPLVWRGEHEFIGGEQEIMELIRTVYLSTGGRPPPPQAAADFSMSTTTYDYDFVVIGGGSGGLAAAKSAAELGANVLLADYVKPSPQGTQWGLGGTCVNVGCIPKKLMHRSSLLGEAAQDAKHFGWTSASMGVTETKDAGNGQQHDWSVMVKSVQDHIRSLNFGYTKELRDKRVEYANALGTFSNAHTIILSNPDDGSSRTVTARRVLVAVGGRPTLLSCPGGEHAITSDDVFSLPSSPGKTLMVGASYISLECAGFLAGLGLDVTVMVRSILLRGFDRDIADKIGEDMEQNHHVKFLRGVVPESIVKNSDGTKTVTWKDGGKDTYDTVLAAIGRRADTSKLGLAAAGVKTNDRNGKILCTNEQTNVPHIYAIGDVVQDVPELTPVAIQSGRMLSQRLFKPGVAEAMDYNLIATTVFTPTEYGAIGLSEEMAIAKFGEDQVEVYHQSFTPLEWTLSSGRPENSCYAKLICDKNDNERVIGLHYLGPDAGEVVQGYAVAMRCGATYKDFHDTVGIHPTVSEKICDMRISKSSGDSADSSGC